MNHLPLLSLGIWVPMLAGVLLLIAPVSWSKSAKPFASMIAGFVFFLFAGIVVRYSSNQWQFNYSETANWIPKLGISYSLGVDGISAWMLALSALLLLVGCLISDPKEKHNQFFGLTLILGSTMVGVFSALNLVLFYIFFELSLVPVALLTLGWGTGEKQRAAVKYLATLFSGSLLMLVGIVVLGYRAKLVTGNWTFNLIDLQALSVEGSLWANATTLQGIAFWGFMLAFLIKSPAVPGHTWLADTYQSAPMSAIIAGVALKVGTYGIFRFCLPLFPEAARSNATIVVLIGVVGILYGGVLAINQKSIGRLMAFSTVSHVGFILIGIFSFSHSGAMGAAFQQVNHGLASGAVFVLLAFLYRRENIRDLDQLGGLKQSMPVFSFMFLIAVLANLGLPLTSGFVGEILALMGTYQSGVLGLGVGFAVLAGIGAILSAAYMLYMFQRMFYGEQKSGLKLPDLTVEERVIGGAMVALLLIGGILPTPMLKQMEKSVLASHLMTLPDTDLKWANGRVEDIESGGRNVRYRSKSGVTELSLYGTKKPSEANAEQGAQ